MCGWRAHSAHARRRPAPTLPACRWLCAALCCSPVGAYCTGGTKTTCAADTSNKLVGAATGAGDCVACDHSGESPMTSEAGADYCTIPWFDVSCGDGTEYDVSSRSCVPCATGTKRASGESSCTAWWVGGVSLGLGGRSACLQCGWPGVIHGAVSKKRCHHQVTSLCDQAPPRASPLAAAALLAPLRPPPPPALPALATVWRLLPAWGRARPALWAASLAATSRAAPHGEAVWLAVRPNAA